jgi:hypothetical protein
VFGNNRIEMHVAGSPRSREGNMLLQAERYSSTRLHPMRQWMTSPSLAM